jgi:hypothetical protein
MGKCPVFKLTRGPIAKSDIDALVAKVSGDGGFWVSGDYESATDLLKPEFSEKILERVLDRIDANFQDRPVLLRCLTGHQVTNQHSETLGDRSEPQECGQLMGSPISFPILCMANLIICRWVLEHVHKAKIPLWKLPMLINGDDVIFHLPDDIRNSGNYTLWKWATQQVGLKFSLGKNYTSRSHLVINSEVWKLSTMVDWYGLPRWFVQEWIPNLNMGLLRTEKKSDSSVSTEQSVAGTHLLQEDSLRARCTAFCQAHPASKRDAAMSYWLSENLDLMKAIVPRGMSYWIHPSLGGLGLPVYREVDITEGQRKLASYLWLSRDPLKRVLTVPKLQLALPTYAKLWFKEKFRVEKRFSREWVPTLFSSPEWAFTITPFVGLGASLFEVDNSLVHSTFMKLFSKAQAGWWKPMSFHNCVNGLGESGPLHAIRSC